MTLACTVCGCTARRACPGGCAWYSEDPPLCTSCYVRRQLAPLFALRKALGVTLTAPGAESARPAEQLGAGPSRPTAARSRTPTSRSRPRKR